MNKEELLKHAKDPKYISGIYNYCDRWCERCQFTSRCLNCTLAEEQFGDLQGIDKFNDAFWQKFSEMLQDIFAMVKEMAKEEGVDIDSIDTEKIYNNEETIKENFLTDVISHISKKYAKSVDDWFNFNEYSFYEKEDELNRIRLISSQNNPVKEAVNITDAIEIIRWYQYQVHVKLARACKSASEEAIDYDNFPKDSDGSAKVALIGIDRSIAAWKILLAYLPADKAEIINLIGLLENIKNRVENRFPCARDFVRPGFDEI
ncbi:MAG: hypothetical protein U9R17_16890 [Thermodesulfobacteriota bacterium]|nr:hypothetical protein [Thermodesulfobacteriota bacterium]